MTDNSDSDPDSGPSGPFVHAAVGMVLLAIGGLLFVNLGEDPELFMLFTVAFAAPGFFLLVSGAVAYGIELSRRPLS